MGVEELVKGVIEQFGPWAGLAFLFLFVQITSIRSSNRIRSDFEKQLIDERQRGLTDQENLRQQLVQQFESRLTEKQTLIDDMEKRFKEVKDKRRILEAKNEELETRVFDLEKSEIMSGVRIDALLGELDLANKRYMEQQQRADGLQSSNNRLVADNQDYMRKNHLLSEEVTELRTLKEEVKHLEARIAELEAENVRLKTEIQSLRPPTSEVAQVEVVPVAELQPEA